MYTPSLCKQTISINEKTHNNQVSPLEIANIAPQQRKGEVVKTKRLKKERIYSEIMKPLHIEYQLKGI